MTLTGRVVKLLWQNPHSFLYVDVIDAKTSRTTSWSIELGSINNLTRLGWTQNSVKPAQEIIVKGIRAFSHENNVLAREITQSFACRPVFSRPRRSADEIPEKIVVFSAIFKTYFG